MDDIALLKSVGRIEYMAYLREHGLSYRKIGKRFDITGSRVRQLLMKHSRKYFLVKRFGIDVFGKKGIQDGRMVRMYAEDIANG